MADENIYNEPFELGELRSAPIFRARGRGRIRLGGRLAKDERAAEWERNLNRYYFACGCDTGAKGTLIGVVGAVLLTINALLRDGFGWTSIIGLSLGMIVVASVTGKLVGLHRANARLRRLIYEIQRDLAPRQAATLPALLCG